MAEEALQKHFPEGGVALRPGVVYGNRCVYVCVCVSVCVQS
jgi:hypothetical protein